MEKNMKGALPVIKIEKFWHDFIWSYITWQIQFSCANWSLIFYYLFIFAWSTLQSFMQFFTKTKKTCTSVHDTKHPLGNWYKNNSSIFCHACLFCAVRCQEYNLETLDPVLGLLVMEIKDVFSLLWGIFKDTEMSIRLFIMHC